MSKAKTFRGTGVAMITPFQKNGEIDFDKLSIHTDRLINQGCDYLVVLGTTAETPTLSGKEKEDVIHCVVDSCGSRVPLMLGVGGNDTRSVVRAIKKTDTGNIDALLSVSPYYNKPGQEGIYQHYAALAAVSDLPLMLYNVPGRTGSNINAETTLRLANDFRETIIGVKEASGDFNQVMKIIADRPHGFLMVSGDDVIALPMIAAGGDGVISVIANAYPSMLSTMTAEALKGSYVKARELHYALFPMVNSIFKEGNPAGVKAAMEVQAWIENVVRLPLIPATSSLQQEMALLNSRLQEFRV